MQDILFQHAARLRYFCFAQDNADPSGDASSSPQLPAVATTAVVASAGDVPRPEMVSLIARAFCYIAVLLRSEFRFCLHGIRFVMIRHQQRLNEVNDPCLILDRGRSQVSHKSQRGWQPYIQAGRLSRKEG